MRRDRGSLHRSSNMTLSVSHTKSVLLSIHVAILSWHTDCESLQAYWFNKFNRFFFGFFRRLSDPKLLCSRTMSIRNFKSIRGFVFPLPRWRISMKGFAYWSSMCLHPLTLTHFDFCVQASTTKPLLSNENHSSQSRLPETKGQCNLGKLLELHSNLL